MIQLDGLIDSYKREVAPPGQFAAAFPSAGDADIQGALADGFAEAQLDGFFGTYTLDPDAMTVDPLLTAAGGALVVLYAGMRTVRNALRMATSTTYKAPGVEYSVQQSTGALTELLRDQRARRAELLALGRRAAGATTTFVLDGYYGRMTVIGGFGAAEIAAVPVALGSL